MVSLLYTSLLLFLSPKSISQSSSSSLQTQAKELGHNSVNCNDTFGWRILPRLQIATIYVNKQEYMCFVQSKVPNNLVTLEK